MTDPQFSVIIPQTVFPLPTSRELSAARVLANYFRSDVVFIPRSEHRSPDFRIGKILWELKTPTGSGKYNIQHTLRCALKQSPNIIIDARFSKTHINKIKSELQYQMKITREIKRLFLIDKDKKVIEIFKNP